MSRKREKEFTPEEAFALTLQEHAPHWYFSSPLLVGVNLPEGSYPQPLDASVTKGTWAFFFVSATGVELSRILGIFQYWLKHFRPLGVSFVFGFRGRYPFFNERKTTENWLKSLNLGTAAFCDLNGASARSFGLGDEAGIAILSQGKIAYVSAGKEGMTGAEACLHGLLRLDSPGLPLWPVRAGELNPLQTRVRWTLHNKSEAITSNQVSLSGVWEFEEDRIVTRDSKAEIVFHAPGSTVEIVARSLSDMGDPTRIRFDSAGASFSDTFAGHDFAVDDEGKSSIILAGPRAYSVLQKLPPLLRNLCFRFPFAKVNPVAIYGFEFGESAKP
jgi:hypothetical protein